LADKRSELRAKGVEVTDIVDHGWSKSIYFKDPNGLSVEYCCFVRNLTQHDARMQERLTMRLSWNPGNQRITQEGVKIAAQRVVQIDSELAALLDAIARFLERRSRRS
jgi:catechol-2,3-dioxygenase